MLGFFELGFLDSFCCTVESSVSGLNFMDTAEASPANFFKDRIVFEIVFFFHLNELIPLDSNFLYFSQIFNRI